MCRSTASCKVDHQILSEIRLHSSNTTHPLWSQHSSTAQNKTLQNFQRLTSHRVQYNGRDFLNQPPKSWSWEFSWKSSMLPDVLLVYLYSTVWENCVSLFVSCLTDRNKHDDPSKISHYLIMLLLNRYLFNLRSISVLSGLLTVNPTKPELMWLRWRFMQKINGCFATLIESLSKVIDMICVKWTDRR